MILVCKHIFSSNFNGLAIYPFIFIKDKTLKNNIRIINHEKIHLKQQLELLWLPFFIWYSIEFLVRLIQFKNKQLAYKNISFEQEAYANELNMNYLKNRKLFSFINYL
jgi:hypothetical protein